MSPLAPNPNLMAGTIEPPRQEPFIGLLTCWDPPKYRLALGPGDHMAIFGNPGNPDAAFRWIFESVSPDGKVITLACDCTVPGCTRTAIYKATFKGTHPQRER